MRFFALSTLLITLLLAAAGWSLTVTQDFSKPEGKTLMELPGMLQWRLLGGQAELTSEGLKIAGENAIVLPKGMPWVKKLRASVELRINERLNSTGWAVAGLTLYRDVSNFWRFEFVEDPDLTNHRLELVENLRANWQAQGPVSKLTEETEGGLTWRYGEWYRFDLELSPERLTGRVTSLANPQETMSISYPVGQSSDVLRQGKLGLFAGAMDMTVRKVTLDLPEEALQSISLSEQPRVLVLDDDLPGYSRKTCETLVEWLRSAGYQTELIDGRSLGDEGLREKCELLVLADSRSFPLLAVPELETFLSQGGRLLALGGPTFQDLVMDTPSGWLPVREALAQTKPSLMVLDDFTRVDVDAMTRASGNPAAICTRSVVSDAPAGLPNALEFKLSDLTNWDTTTVARYEQSPFPADDWLTCLWAKGEKGRSLNVEWKESDGTRWIAVVELAGDWKHYVLRPEDFKFWSDGSPPERESTKPRFTQAMALTIGPASGFGPFRPGPMTYQVAGIGLAESPLADFVQQQPPTMELLYPWYKQWQTQESLEGMACASQALLASDWQLDCAKFQLPMLRPMATLFGNEFQARFVPLVECRDETGRFRAYFASLYFRYSGWLEGGAWGLVGLPAQQLIELSADRAQQLVTAMAKGLLSPVQLTGAGARKYTWREGEDQTVTCGATLTNEGAEEAPLRVSFGLQHAKDAGWSRTESYDVTLEPLGSASVSFDVSLSDMPEGHYVLTTRLYKGDSLVDELRSEFLVIHDLELDPARLVSVEGGEFRKDGKRWYAHGINYWPLMVAGQEASDYWGHWTKSINYQPEFIQRDLELIKELGMNSVSIQYTSPEFADATRDFLWRCKELGIQVNVFLGNADPRGLDRKTVRQLFEGANLADFDNIWCYDVAWEPHLGAHNERKAYDAAWRLWIDEQYGSVEAAEADWGFEAPRDDEGRLTNPPDEYFTTDGPWRVISAAYRRFADDFISHGYRDVKQYLQSLGGVQLMGARSGWGGTMEVWPEHALPFDLRAGAKSLDFTSPEAYGMATDWEGARRKGFVGAYARWAGNGKPVFWAEFGLPVYPNSGYEDYLNKLRLQGDIWENMYKVCLDSYADGDAGWWWVGGYRIGENSDFGIISPDYTIRPAAQMVLDYAEELNEMQPAPAPEVFINYDRDATAAGNPALWQQHDAEYLAAREAGKWVEVLTDGTGTTTATMPVIAVGNVPFTGHNPLKYANAEFNWLEVQNAEGAWVRLVSGAEVQVKSGEPVRLRCSVGNTGEATWLAVGDRRVSLEAAESSDLPFRASLTRDVPRFGDYNFGEFALCSGLAQNTQVKLRLEVEGLGGFGEALQFTLIPVQESN